MAGRFKSYEQVRCLLKWHIFLLCRDFSGCTAECFLRKPNWYGSKILFLSSRSVICFIITFSYTLIIGDNCAMGRQLFRSCLSFFGLGIGVILMFLGLWEILLHVSFCWYIGLDLYLCEDGSFSILYSIFHLGRF